MAFWDNPSDLLPKQQNRWIISFGKHDVTDATNINKLPFYFAKSVDRPSFDIGIIQAKYLYSHTFNFPKRPVWKPIKITFYDAIVTAALERGLGQKFITDYTISSNKKQAVIIDSHRSTQLFFYNLLLEAGYIQPQDKDYNEDNNLRFRSYPFKSSLISSLVGEDNKLTIYEIPPFLTDKDKIKTNPEGIRLGKNYKFNDDLNIGKEDAREDQRTVYSTLQTFKENAYEGWELYNPLISDVNFDRLDYTSDLIASVTITLYYDWAKLILQGTGAVPKSPSVTEKKAEEKKQETPMVEEAKSKPTGGQPPVEPPAPVPPPAPPPVEPPVEPPVKPPAPVPPTGGQPILEKIGGKEDNLEEKIYSNPTPQEFRNGGVIGGTIKLGGISAPKEPTLLDILNENPVDFGKPTIPNIPESKPEFPIGFTSRGESSNPDLSLKPAGPREITIEIPKLGEKAPTPPLEYIETPVPEIERKPANIQPEFPDSRPGEIEELDEQIAQIKRIGEETERREKTAELAKKTFGDLVYEKKAEMPGIPVYNPEPITEERLEAYESFEGQGENTRKVVEQRKELITIPAGTRVVDYQDPFKVTFTDYEWRSSGLLESAPYKTYVDFLTGGREWDTLSPDERFTINEQLSQFETEAEVYAEQRRERRRASVRRTSQQ